MGYQFEPLSYKVLGACIAVQRQLGPHCMEVDYQRALELELRKLLLEYIREAEIPISYDGIEVTRRTRGFCDLGRHPHRDLGDQGGEGDAP